MLHCKEILSLLQVVVRITVIENLTSPSNLTFNKEHTDQSYLFMINKVKCELFVPLLLHTTLISTKALDNYRIPFALRQIEMSVWVYVWVEGWVQEDEWKNTSSVVAIWVGFILIRLGPVKRPFFSILLSFLRPRPWSGKFRKPSGQPKWRGDFFACSFFRNTNKAQKETRRGQKEEQ